MKIQSYFLLICSVLFVFFSCNQDEGIGGSSSVEGYVYNVRHSDDNFSFTKDTFPALDQRVFLQYPSDLKDVRTDKDGKYRVNFLRSGNYEIYAVSEFVGGSMKAEVVDVRVSGNLTIADTIFIHTGKANGTAMIRGSVYATMWHNARYQGEGPAVGARVYIKNAGEEAFFDDLRVSDKGVFIFQKILPGEYEIHVTTEDPVTRVVTTVFESIKVTETGKIYNLSQEKETPEGNFTFIIDII